MKRLVQLGIALLAVCAIAADPNTPAKPPSLELDLRSSSEVTSVLVLPPIVHAVEKQGAFAGVDTRKSVDKFDFQSHKTLVTEFNKELDGKTIPATSVSGVLSKLNVNASMVQQMESIAKLAAATRVDWVVGFEFTKAATVVGIIYDETGKQVGRPSFVNVSGALTQVQASELVAIITKQLIEFARAKARVEATALPPPPPPPPPEEELADADLAAQNRELARAEAEVAGTLSPQFAPADRSRPRLIAAIGTGAAIRDFKLSGSAADTIGSLKSAEVVALGLYAMVNPLEFFDATRGQRWSDAELEVNYRRSLMYARGTSGSIAGQKCPMVDDDLQIRGTWRYKVANGEYMPHVGVGGAWSQEQTKFDCSFPFVSTVYRGVDAQLRVKQPLFRDMVALDVSFGPRILLGGAPDVKTNLSLVGEAWIEVKPFSLLFGRAGARVSSLRVGDAGVSISETRAFFAIEVGAFL